MPISKKPVGKDPSYVGQVKPEKMTRAWAPAKPVIPGWAPYGACRTEDKGLFTDWARRNEAIEICVECPVMIVCGESAHPGTEGIRGGRWLGGGSYNSVGAVPPPQLSSDWASP